MNVILRQSNSTDFSVHIFAQRKYVRLLKRFSFEQYDSRIRSEINNDREHKLLHTFRLD